MTPRRAPVRAAPTVPVPSRIVPRSQGGPGAALLVLCLATAAPLLAAGCGSGDASMIHDDVATLPFQRWDGTSTTLADLVAADGRPLVVNLWATWCTPCLEEMPHLQAAHEDRGDTINFVGLNISDSPTRAAARADEMGITYLLGRDPDGNFSEALGAVGLPVTAFVNSAGQVVHVQHGPLDAEALATAIADRLSTP